MSASDKTLTFLRIDRLLRLKLDISPVAPSSSLSTLQRGVALGRPENPHGEKRVFVLEPCSVSSNLAAVVCQRDSVQNIGVTNRDSAFAHGFEDSSPRAGLALRDSVLSGLPYEKAVLRPSYQVPLP